MTDAEAMATDVDEQDAAGDGEDQPEMDDDEIADVDLDALAEEVEAEAGADAPDIEEDTTDDETAPEGAVDNPSEDLSPEGESWGDMYVGTLTTVSNAIIEEHGNDGAEEIGEDLARQLHLDEHFNEFMAERGKSDMPPEQALLIGTTMFLVAVVGTKTDLPSTLLQEANL